MEPGTRGASTDAELWVDRDAWAEAVAAVREVSEGLHRGAKPPRTEGAVHVSLTLAMFAMTEASAAEERS
jgi:hypothetical protein